MKSFIGTFENKIDSKGRISVPATFRAVINAKSLNSVICYSSLTGPCIEGCGLDRIERGRMRELVKELGLYPGNHPKNVLRILDTFHDQLHNNKDQEEAIEFRRNGKIFKFT